MICDLVQDFQLVCFHPLAIEDKESVYKIVKTVDKANGYIYGGLSEGNECILDLIHSNPLNSDWYFYFFYVIFLFFTVSPGLLMYKKNMLMDLIREIL